MLKLYQLTSSHILACTRYVQYLLSTANNSTVLDRHRQDYLSRPMLARYVGTANNSTVLDRHRQDYLSRPMLAWYVGTCEGTIRAI